MDKLTNLVLDPGMLKSNSAKFESRIVCKDRFNNLINCTVVYLVIRLNKRVLSLCSGISSIWVNSVVLLSRKLTIPDIDTEILCFVERESF